MIILTYINFLIAFILSLLFWRRVIIKKQHFLNQNFILVILWAITCIISLAIAVQLSIKYLP